MRHLMHLPLLLSTGRCASLLVPLIVLSYSLSVSAGAGGVTHSCTLWMDGTQQESRLDCKQLQDAAAADCGLVMYYNNTGPFPTSSNLVGWLRPPFGVPAKPLPSPVPPWESAAFNKTETSINRTEVIYKATIWPVVFFHGGPSCHVLLVSPRIHHVQPGRRLRSLDSTAVLAFGGGLTATIEDGSITDSLADMGVLVLANTTLTVRHTNFTGNAVMKGSLYASWASQINLRHVTFRGNEASDEGAGVYVVGARAAIADCTFDSNAANGGGAAAFVKFSNVTVRGSSISNNTAPTGGAVGVYDGSVVTFERGCNLTDNTARILAGTVTDTGSNYYKLGVGGTLYMEHSKVMFLDSQLLNNRAVMDGGAVRVLLGQLNITNSNVSANTAHRNGGALLVGTVKELPTATSTLWVTNTEFLNNTAQANGGAIMLDRLAHTFIKDCVFEENRAWSEGGGICTEMADADDDKDNQALRRDQDLNTSLVLDNVSFLGKWQQLSKIAAGPYFRMVFKNTVLNVSSDGVTSRRRLCSKGEYVSPSRYCQACPSYQFSTVVEVPGHSRTECEMAPRLAHAPGGAVLVPLSGAWHGATSTSVDRCVGCPWLNITLKDIKRCPNPAACQQDERYLASRHPDSTSSDRLPWANYSRQLCNYGDGYEGVLCGRCRPNYGMTAPFKCNLCLGSQPSNSPDGDPTQQQRPWPGPISALYLVYWFVLTCWLLLCVRFSKPAPARPRTSLQPSVPRPVTEWQKTGRQASEGDVCSSSKDQQPLQSNEEKKDVQDMPSQVQQRARGNSNTIGGWRRGSTARGSDKNTSRSIDITKALIIYTQWVMLVINLPVSWMPWAVTGAATNGSSSNSSSGLSTLANWIVGLLFGRSASLDCFLQAWRVLQGTHVKEIVANVFVRALGSAVVVPAALFLSVLVLLLLARALRRPFLRTLDRLCTHSTFFRRHHAGRLASSTTQGSAPGLSRSFDSAVELQQRGAHAPSGSSLGDAAAASGFGSVTASPFSSPPSFISGASVSSVLSIDMPQESLWQVLRDNCIRTALATSMFVYISIAKVAFGMLLCVRIGFSYRWVLDVRLQCPVRGEASTAWAAWAVVFGVLLLCACIAWPLGIAWVLIREAHRGRLLRVDGSRGMLRVLSSAGAASDPPTTANWAVRYADYAVEYDTLSGSVAGSGTQGDHPEEPFFWRQAWRPAAFVATLGRLRKYAVLCFDSILDLHRLAISLVSQCVMLHELHQLSLLVVALGSYLLLVLLVKPWRAATVWHLQVLALAILLGSCLGIMACTVSDAGAYYADSTWQQFTTIIRVLVLVANLAYLVLLLVLLVRCVVREMPKLADLRKFLRRRWQKLRVRQQRAWAAAA